MATFKRVILISVMVTTLTACAGTTETPESTPLPQIPTSTSAIVPTLPTEPCSMIPTSDIISYLRPSLMSEEFDILTSGMPFFVEVRTADGWIGFSPGIPQAANVGVFRYRWVQEDANFRLEGACQDLPIVEGPPPGICFTMAMTEIPIYVERDVSSEVLTTLESEDFIQVIERSTDDWLKVDLSVGSVEIAVIGWMEGMWANFNGPCSEMVGAPVGPRIVQLTPGDLFTITFIQMNTDQIGWAVGRGSEVEDHIFRTTDGGETWLDITPPESQINEAVIEKQALLASLTDQVARVAYFNQDASYAMQTISFWSTNNGGETWISGGVTEPLERSEYPGIIEFVDPDVGWILTKSSVGMGHDAYNLFRTLDGGLTYEMIQSIPDTESTCSWTGMDFNNAEVGWLTQMCPFQPESVFLDWTEDGGESWQQQMLSLPTEISERDLDISFCVTHAPILFSRTQGILIVECFMRESETGDTTRFLLSTQDLGNSWQTYPLPETDYPTEYLGSRQFLAFLNPLQGWLLGRDIFWTEDGGSSWTRVKRVNWDGQFSFIDSDRGWAVVRADGEIALVRTNDGGRTWEQLEPAIAASEGAALDAPCTLIATGAATAYRRPSLEAEIFAQLPTDTPFFVEAQTADGWIGFDPAYAQAANIGVFHHRWVPGDAEVTLDGNCESIPVVVGPAPGVCFTMPMDDAPIFVEPDTSSSTIVTLVVYDYAKVAGKNEDGWYAVDLRVGNLGLDALGWMESIHVNFNGPCQDLPIVTP